MDLPGYITFIYLIKWNRSWPQLHVSLLSGSDEVNRIISDLYHSSTGQMEISVAAGLSYR